MKAHQILEAGLGHMKDRSATYDKPAGERSMGATVDAFRAITGHDLTEEQGWLFMGLLKMVRSQQGGFRADNYEDLAAYAGLQGEAAWAERANQDFGQQNTIDCRTDAENVQQPGPAWTLEARRCLVCFGEHGSAPCPQTRITASVVNDPRTVVGLDLSFPTEKHMNFAPACEHVFDINGWREAEGGSKQWFSKCSKCGVEVDSE
ncbi:DUF6378 domain-containing protein [Stutzerimonas stutzeri]|uniref:DUF6378 domain-containing protein n=1 Tax=Stutzerimonas stutzeri KOS6 TaxID=1218352 RepID=A0A061JN03_STUST|nr:DUF6378 domain-containing protein [Stutzerimonas stutzeri]EWC39569.1 hypothetical protein B597_019455 [Stutzerimonas stutzeri KOS6]